MQEFVGILGLLLAVNFLPTTVAVLLCIDEGWRKFWKYFGIGWAAQLGVLVLCVIGFSIMCMIIWGFNLG